MCAAFLANIDEHKSAHVKFNGQSYTLPPWSVSVLPDCRHVAFNTAKVGAQTSVKTVKSARPSLGSMSILQKVVRQDNVSYISKSWMALKEPIGIWGENNFTFQGLLEHLNVTKDRSDYLWHKTRISVSEDDISFWKINGANPTVSIDSMRDVLRVFVNKQLSGSIVGHWVKAVQPVRFIQGNNDLLLLTQTVGLQNYGAFLEKDGAGFRGKAKLTGFKNGDLDLSKSSWTYQVGLKGEADKIYTVEHNEKAEWSTLETDASPSIFMWYKTYFDPPAGTDPVVLDLESMGKGQAWVNGHHIGRYWNIISQKDGCDRTCDYRGAYNSDKCTTNCGKPTQTRYHIPRSWLKPSSNLLVLFEETGGNPFKISVKTVTAGILCGQVLESHYPPLRKWSTPDYINGTTLINSVAPEVHLHCEDGHVISSIEFASYGTPRGSCDGFSIGKCHASNSLSIVSEACKGRNSCFIEVSNTAFISDPCSGTLKTLTVMARCSPSQNMSDLSF